MWWWELDSINITEGKNYCRERKLPFFLCSSTFLSKMDLSWPGTLCASLFESISSRPVIQDIHKNRSATFRAVFYRFDLTIRFAHSLISLSIILKDCAIILFWYPRLQEVSRITVNKKMKNGITALISDPENTQIANQTIKAQFFSKKYYQKSYPSFAGS